VSVGAGTSAAGASTTRFEAIFDEAVSGSASSTGGSSSATVLEDLDRDFMTGPLGGAHGRMRAERNP
jgi:hypothetical protein